MSADPRRRELERAAGAVIVPEVRAPGTRPGAFAASPPARPERAYLERHPPAGVVVFGSSAAGPVDPGELLAAVRSDAEALGEPEPFAACDLEQGAGLHFVAGTRLPPALALAAAAAGKGGGEERGLAWIRKAGAITGAEARELGIELVLAPVADLVTGGENSIVAVRGYGDEPERVAARALAFHEGLRQGGVAACAKHFPGLGAASADRDGGLPRVAREGRELERLDLAPFRALIADGIACVMTGHLDVPALTDEPGLPATLSPRLLRGLLRERLGFSGVLLSEAMDMGALFGFERRHARAVAAGCDGLLCPSDPLAAAGELVAAVEQGTLPEQRLREAARRMRGLRDQLKAVRARPDPDGIEPSGLPGSGPRGQRARFAVEAAGAALCLSTARWSWKPGRPCEVLAPLHQAHTQEAREGLNRLRARLAHGVRPAGAALPVVGETRAGRGTDGPGPGALSEIEAKVAALRALGWPVGLLWLASPKSLPAAWWVRGEVPVLVAFAPTPPLIEALARFLEGRIRALGCLPVHPG